MRDPPLPQAAVSVVVCSNGRPEALKALHAALWRQTYSRFEIVYVIGPAEDRASSQAAKWALAPGVKTARCAAANLSMARNIGIAEACGDLIAFVDDDALPEPSWLARLAETFDAPDVGIAGGAVLDPGGADYQFRYSAADRFGDSHHDLPLPFDDGAYPLSPLYPHVMGTNFMVRRDLLVELGGFDEEFEYFLDETDLCCRAIDAGHFVRQQPLAVVHHKFLPNALRGESKILVSKFPVLKNKVYFCLVNDRGHATLSESLTHLLDFFARHRADLARHVAAGRVPPPALDQFDADAERAWRQGLQRGLSKQRRLHSDRFGEPRDFVAFAPSRSARSGVHILIAGDATPQASVALARAKQLTTEGRHAHVVFGGADADDAELRDGVWMHWRKPRYFPMHVRVKDMGLPEPLWHGFATTCAEVRRLAACAAAREIEDLSGQGVSLPLLWEGAPAPLAVRLYAHGLKLPARMEQAGGLGADIGSVLHAAERTLLEGAAIVRVENSRVRDAIEQRHGVGLASVLEQLPAMT